MGRCTQVPFAIKRQDRCLQPCDITPGSTDNCNSGCTCPAGTICSSTPGLAIKCVEKVTNLTTGTLLKAYYKYKTEYYITRLSWGIQVDQQVVSPAGDLDPNYFYDCGHFQYKTIDNYWVRGQARVWAGGGVGGGVLPLRHVEPSARPCGA
jgi:hypothetical protein